MGEQKHHHFVQTPLGWTEVMWKTVLCTDQSGSFWEIMDAACIQMKTLLIYARPCHPPWWYCRGISACGGEYLVHPWQQHWCWPVSTDFEETYVTTQIPSVSLWERRAYFRIAMPNPILHVSQPFKKIWNNMKLNIWQRQSRSMEQLANLQQARTLFKEGRRHHTVKYSLAHSF